MKMNNGNPLTHALALLLCLCMMTTMASAADGMDEKGVIVPEEYAGLLILEDPALFMYLEEDVGTPTATNEPDTTDTPSPTDEPTPTQEPTPTNSPTEEPEQPAVQPQYDIGISVPTGWRSAATANATVSVADKNGTGWKKIEVLAPGKAWQDVTSDFASATSLSIEVSKNGTLKVRVTDPNDTQHEESKDVYCFDREAPIVTAGIRNVLLHVEAKDSLSGVAGIQVNGLLFTTLENGMLDVRMEELLNGYEKLGIRAFDYAGNFSDPVLIDNPYYAPEATAVPTKAPTATPKPTQKPSTGGSTATPTPTKKPGSAGASTTALPTVIPTATLEPTILHTLEPAVITATIAPTTDYISLEPGTPFKADSNMQTLDLLYSAHTNKQFITVQTRNGETYFLIIDYDKPIDEEANLYETYFLNLVDDRDLLAILGEDAMPTPEPTVVVATPEPTATPAPEPVKEPEKSNNSGMMLLIIALLAGGGALWYFKFRKGDGGKKQSSFDEYDFGDDDEDDEADEEEIEEE